jgi:hypothetical protein
MVGLWFTVELSSWSWGRLIGSVVFGSCLIVGLFGTALEVAGQAAVSYLARSVRIALVQPLSGQRGTRPHHDQGGVRAYRRRIDRALGQTDLHAGRLANSARGAKLPRGEGPCV